MCDHLSILDDILDDNQNNNFTENLHDSTNEFYDVDSITNNVTKQFAKDTFNEVKQFLDDFSNFNANK